MTARILIGFLLVSLVFISCEKENQVEPPTPIDYDLECEKFVDISANLYETAQSAFFYADSIAINGNCLEITITASGCNGASWEAVLVDSEAIMESSPIQRQAHFILKNDELCLAIFQRTFTFDLQPLQYDGDNKILLNIDEFGSILYEY